MDQRFLQVAAVAQTVLRDDVCELSPAWHLAAEVVRLSREGRLDERSAELLTGLWYDAVEGARHGAMKRCVASSSYLLATYRALECEDGMILEQGAYWIGMARAWQEGRVPNEVTDEPRAYQDLEAEFSALQSKRKAAAVEPLALPEWLRAPQILPAARLKPQTRAAAASGAPRERKRRPRAAESRPT